MREAFGEDGVQRRLCFLSGPSFAKEIVEKQPTAVVVAGSVLPDAVIVQRAMSSKYFRVYTSMDTVGVELGGALKNPLAVAAGDSTFGRSQLLQATAHRPAPC
jgi:glycerol-3-phosphate dehydrogenase